MSKFMIIPMDRIHIGERFRKDCGSLQSLATSISKMGLLHPIIVHEEEDNTYMLLSGFRRLQANKLLGLKTISANVMGGNDK